MREVPLLVKAAEGPHKVKVARVQYGCPDFTSSGGLLAEREQDPAL